MRQGTTFAQNRTTCANSASADPKTDSQDVRIKELVAPIERDEEDALEKQFEAILEMDDDEARKRMGEELERETEELPEDQVVGAEKQDEPRG